MPKILIKRGDWKRSDHPDLACGEPAYWYRDGRNRLLIGDDPSQTSEGDSVTVKGADYASKIGTKDSQSPIGSAIKPVYVASDGTVTQSNASVGTDETTADPTDSTKGLKPIVMASGTFVAATESHGTADQPVYVNSGKIIPGQKYGGGTKVTINGADKGHSTATIYAPETAGTRDGQISVWDEHFGKPDWTSQTYGGDYQPIYIYRGVPTAISITQGGTDTPVYFNGGIISSCAKYSGGSRVSLNSMSSAYTSDPRFFAPDAPPSNAGNTAAEHTLVEWYDYGSKCRFSTDNEGNSTDTPVYLDSGRIRPCAKYAGGTKVTLNGNPKGSSTASFYAPTTLGPVNRISILTTQDNTLKWSDCAFTKTVYTPESDNVWDTTVSDITKGIYAILAFESTLGEYYTFYVIIHDMTIGNTYVSTSYTTQPTVGFTPACCVVATVASASSANFKVTENSGNRDWYFRKIYKVNNIG